MQLNSMIKILPKALNFLFKKDLTKEEQKAIKEEYFNIMTRAKDIGAKNNLLNSYTLAAYFISMTRRTNKSPEVCIKIMNDNLRRSKLFKMLMGSSKNYFSEKKMEFRRNWSKETYKRKYENDWIVDFIEPSKDYVFGFDYKECGVCKLCKDEGCKELAKYLCQLDYMIVEVIGIKLTRTKTLAEGYDCCDFRFSNKD